jgi:hypothetical protein
MTNRNSLTPEQLDALLHYFKVIRDGKCAPYDISFKERDALDELIAALSPEETEETDE